MSSKILFAIGSWTSISNTSYYGITCHFYDSWKIELLVLDFISSKGNHSKHMATIFFNVLKEYNIVEKIQEITTDNADNNFTFINHLQSLIRRNWINFYNANRHFICFAHVLNLAEQDLIRIVNVTIYTRNL